MTEFATKPKKKSIEQMTNMYAPFWEDMLNKEPSNYFISKLAYKPKGSKDYSTRLYGSELGKGDVYFEFHDWDSNHFHAGERVLYKLTNDPDWRDKIGTIYMPTETENSYIVKLSSLIKVSSSPVTALTPKPIQKLEEKSTTTEMFPFDIKEPQSEKDDSHQTAMTIRDWYSIINNVPVSNKEWLNKLIIENKK